MSKRSRNRTLRKERTVPSVNFYETLNVRLLAVSIKKQIN